MTLKKMEHRPGSIVTFYFSKLYLENVILVVRIIWFPDYFLMLSKKYMGCFYKRENWFMFG